MVDVPLTDHRTISRQHAAICHGCPPSMSPSKQLVLIDLSSANGTFVRSNGVLRRLDPNEPVGLTEGMHIRFGESKRVCVVKGLSRETGVHSTEPGGHNTSKLEHGKKRKPSPEDDRQEKADSSRTSRGKGSSGVQGQGQTTVESRERNNHPLDEKQVKRRALWSHKKDEPMDSSTGHWTAAAQTLGSDTSNKFLRLMGAKKNSKNAVQKPPQGNSSHGKDDSSSASSSQNSTLQKEQSEIASNLERGYQSGLMYNRGRMGLGS
eukprot:CAMPEP_0185748166 /NCGR_PEP_ID=MMETSP1174-20130828/6841_1 /TAXON_ID=35687 /ORGANISM="Dictyocha speculum, Strain CCMP1381" /LENGTH=263 /DNA_ID=CAMNT_0028423699 /DNA_START=158 /DNA_END=949 /DNA_ORIENTATION=-